MSSPWLLVPCGQPPAAQWSSSTYQAHPAGPGLPRAEPSAAAMIVTAQESASCLRWRSWTSRRPTSVVQRFADLDPVVAYRLWALRSQVFVVEQAAAYLDLDGRDTEPGTWHVWCADDAGARSRRCGCSTTRLAWRVGRVARRTRPTAGEGSPAAMVREVLSRLGGPRDRPRRAGVPQGLVCRRSASS